MKWGGGDVEEGWSAPFVLSLPVQTLVCVPEAPPRRALCTEEGADGTPRQLRCSSDERYVEIDDLDFTRLKWGA